MLTSVCHSNFSPSFLLQISARHLTSSRLRCDCDGRHVLSPIHLRPIFVHCGCWVYRSYSISGYRIPVADRLFWGIATPAICAPHSTPNLARPTSTGMVRRINAMIGGVLPLLPASFRLSTSFSCPTPSRLSRISDVTDALSQSTALCIANLPVTHDGPGFSDRLVHPVLSSVR